MRAAAASFFTRRLFVAGLALFFVVGLLVIRVAKGVVYASQAKKTESAEALILTPYTQTVAAKNNAIERAQVGQSLLEKDLPLYAAINFAQAATLDPNYRDAAYGWAYALLQAKGDHLSEQDSQNIHKAITQAEAVDPLYPPLLELKKIVAEAENKPDVMQQVAERLQLLSQK